ncbi:hypothetical protein TNCV_2164821 [Trichonephila clavipes]|nr:hypothetical protein TNCV_2164821 [Trichonephila clavipes]
MLNDDEIVTSMQEKSDPVDDETDEDEDSNNNESSKGPLNADAFSALETAIERLLCKVVPARISSQSNRHCWRSPLPHVSVLIQRDLGCDLGVQQTKQIPHVAKVNLVWQLGV